MAQGLLAARLPRARVRSAGLGALIGMPADPFAVQLLKAQGIDISKHRAEQITRQACLDADLILVMDGEQRRRVENLYPQVRGRVFKLGEYTKTDIPDPYRKDEIAFSHALSLITGSAAEWLKRIERL
jgi:protein-tyrosine phosphatase